MLTLSDKDLLNALRLPARVDTKQTATLLGFQPHDISTLVTYGKLKPLGQPAANGPKFFATVKILQLAGETKWLSEATNVIIRNWKKRNTRHQTAETDASPTLKTPPKP
jgi:hypothetical protein